MFQNIADFLMESFLKFGSRLPQSPFDVDDYISNLNVLLGKINYFIPFNILSRIFNAWVVAVFAAFGIYLFIKFLRNLLGK